MQLFPINMEDENVKKYTLKRVITALFTLLAILLVLFVLMQLMPGSPFNDEKLNDSQRAALYAKYGLDQPVVVQFFRYVGNMLRGDFGVSYNISKNTPISQLIQTRLPISILIGGFAVLIGASMLCSRGSAAAATNVQQPQEKLPIKAQYNLGFYRNDHFGYRSIRAVLCVCAGTQLFFRI